MEQINLKNSLSLEPLLSDIEFIVPFAKSEEIDQVIVGAETGHHARPCNLDWIRNIRDQCRDAEIPFSKAGQF